MRNYDVAALIWPAYSGDDPRSRILWSEGFGEWQSVKNAESKFPGHRWPRRPTWGYVNEGDPYLMEMEIEAATDHGVNVFIYDWYWYDRRPFLENCLNDGFLKARNRHKMKFYLMWANHCSRYNWDKRNCNLPNDNPLWSSLVDEAEFVRMTDRIIEKYFKEPNYYTINGCPVFMIYTINELLDSFGSLDNIKKALDGFRERTVKAGFPGLHLQFIVREDKIISIPKYNIEMSQCQLMEAIGMDSVTTPMNGGYWGTDYAESLVKLREYHKIMETYSMPFFPGVYIGWDNNPRYDAKTVMYAVTENTGPDQFEKALRIAKEYMDKHTENPPLMVINAWNEWTENNYLQPDDIHGYAMLEAVKRVFKS